MKESEKIFIKVEIRKGVHKYVWRDDPERQKKKTYIAPKSTNKEGYRKTGCLDGVNFTYTKLSEM